MTTKLWLLFLLLLSCGCANRPQYESCLSVRLSVCPVRADNSKKNKSPAVARVGLADRTHGAHSQPASITVRVWCFEHVVACARNVNLPIYITCSLRYDNVITSKPTWKLKHTNCILVYFEYFCQMSSKSILIISTYTVSKSGRISRHSVHLLSSVRCGPQCSVAGSTLLHCPSPRLPAVTSSRRRHVTAGVTSSSVREYRVGFVMDDVETVRDLSAHFPDVRSVFHVYSDPVFHEFRAGKKIYKGEALILTVRFSRPPVP